MNEETRNLLAYQLCSVIFEKHIKELNIRSRDITMIKVTFILINKTIIEEVKSLK